MKNDCGENIKEEKNKVDFSEKLNERSKVKKVIGVVSGKGGVGKSIVTSMLAVTMNRMGYKTAILDADITGPSIPKIFGIKEKAQSDGLGLYPVKTKTGIDIMSVNLLLENDTDPVIWRSPIITSMVKQFWSDVIWEDIDYMFIDMPPGTGDVPLTVFQSIAVDGIIVVTSPQELVSMIVSKAVNMAETMNIPIIGLVENMSYFKCPDTNNEYKIFGNSHIEEISKKHNLNLLSKLPIEPKIAESCDNGTIEDFKCEELESVEKILKNMSLKKVLKIAVASEGDIITDHFGHCSNFNIFEVKDNHIVKNESLDNPGHKPGFLPNFLNDKGVNVIISGGMGAGAIDIFNEKGIDVIVGADGSSKEAVNKYIRGELKSSGIICNEHINKDNCSGHIE